MRNAADNVVTIANGTDQEQRGWLAPALVCVGAWAAAIAATLTFDGWAGASLGLVACICVPAVWLFGEILFNQD